MWTSLVHNTFSFLRRAVQTAESCAPSTTAIPASTPSEPAKNKRTNDGCGKPARCHEPPPAPATAVLEVLVPPEPPAPASATET
jgi:hypothetical protein